MTWARYALLLLLPVALLGAVGWDLALRGLHRYPPEPIWPVPAGDPARGEVAILAYGCGACHVIPGIRDATGRVGPKLIDLAEQVYIGGVVPNTPQNLIAWILDPREIDPLTAMPDLGVTEAEARDIAAYLYSLTPRDQPTIPLIPDQTK